MQFSLITICLCLSGLLSPLQAGEWIAPHPIEQEETAPVALLPFPVKVSWNQGQCKLSTKPQSILKPALIDRLGREGYLLSISDKGIQIQAATKTGLFYAQRTLDQLGARGFYPYCQIEDFPAFPVRGFMHDTGRNFQSLDYLKSQLDVMAALKLNTFHWHLTDHPAWRIESKKYPVLNDPAKRRQGRGEDKTYSMKDIKSLFDYAKARHIQIIPEIDMPGHSEYFEKCFGCKMHSPKGMDILEELLNEFLGQVTPEMAPYFHFGADEVRIPNAKEFVTRISTLLKKHQRIPLQWAGPHDLPVDPNNVAQLWNDENSSKLPQSEKQPGSYIDSSMGYMNAFEPNLLVRRIFYRQPCGVARGDKKALGPIICLWPDVRVDDQTKTALQSGQWPTLFAMAERSWKGLAQDTSQYAGNPAPLGSEAQRSFALFQKRMEQLSTKLPFPYWRDNMMQWTIYGPTKSDKNETIARELLQNQIPQGVSQREINGGSLIFKSRAAQVGLFSQTKPGHTVWAKTFIDLPQAKTVHFIVGFDSPARSTRRCSGVPHPGEWSQCGTKIWLNGKVLKNSQQLSLAGQRRFEKHTWFTQANELPFDNEEFWWLREPVAIPLNKGINTFLIEQPYTGDFQNWGITLIPVKKVNNKWVSDDSIRSQATLTTSAH